MTPEETQRRVAALEARAQDLDKKLSAVQPAVVQQTTSSSVVLGALPSSLKNILHLGFAWVANQVSVKAGLGIVVDTTGVRAKIKSGGGLSVDTDGLYSGVNPSDYIAHALATAASDFLVSSGANEFIKKTLAEVKTLIGITDTDNIDPGHKHSILWADDGSIGVVYAYTDGWIEVVGGIEVDEGIYSYADVQILTAGKGIVLINAAGTVTKRVRLNDAGDGLIFEAP